MTRGSPKAARQRAAIASAADDPLWYKDAIIYELHVRAFFDSDGDGIGRLPGPDREARLPRTTSASPPSGCCRSTRRRCKDDGYDIADYDERQARRTARCATSRRFLARGARARPARHHRAGLQPHLRPAPVVPARAPRAAGQRLSATSTSGATRPSKYKRRAHHLQGLRALELDLGSGRQGLLLAPLLLATSPT